MAACCRCAAAIGAASSHQHACRLPLHRCSQAPGLPYQLPRQLTDYPALAGGATLLLALGPWLLCRWDCVACWQLSRSAAGRCACLCMTSLLAALVVGGTAGRAVVELTVEKASGERVFVDQNSDAGPQKRAKLQLVLDGYSGGARGPLQGASQADAPGH